MVLKRVVRNVALLSAAQAAAMTTTNINLIITSLVGTLIAPEPWLATLPLSLLFIGSMLTTLPASLLMGRFGRRPVFIIGVLFATTGCIGLGIATIANSFALYTIMSIALGIGHGIAHFYRYAATDDAAEDDKPKSLSLVLAGGIVAALAGGTLARMSFTIIPDHLYAGCFFVAASVQASSLIVLSFLKFRKAPPTKKQTTTPIAQFFRRPLFVAGILSAALGYGVMTFVMTATPLQIVNTELLGDHNNAIIIQWHVLAMLAPSFITGNLIARFGVINILWVGIAFYLMMMAVTLSGSGFWHYFATLILLGLGWNMLFVGGSTIVAQSCSPQERPAVQGMADLTITGMTAFSSMTAAAMHYLLGWQMMIMAISVFVAVIATAIIVAMLSPESEPSRR